MIRSAPSIVACRYRGELCFVDIVEPQAVTHQAEIRDEAEAAGAGADDGDCFDFVISQKAFPSPQLSPPFAPISISTPAHE